MGIEASGSESFIEVGPLGFHPADEKAVAGTAIAYHTVDDMDAAIERASVYGFDLYRGPLDLAQFTVAQLRDTVGSKVGMIIEHGSNE